jgi:hypothetical protein
MDTSQEDLVVLAQPWRLRSARFHSVTCRLTLSATNPDRSHGDPLTSACCVCIVRHCKCLRWGGRWAGGDPRQDGGGRQTVRGILPSTSSTSTSSTYRTFATLTVRMPVPDRKVWLEQYPLPPKAQEGNAPLETWHLTENTFRQTLCGISTGALDSVATSWADVPRRCGVCNLVWSETAR